MTTDIKLNESVNAQMNSIIESGFIEQTIKSQLEKTISGIVNDSLKEYSDFGKAIKEKINAVLPLAASNVELPEYNKFVADICTKTFDKLLHEQAQEQIETLLKADLGVMENKVITAQDIQNEIEKCFEPEEYEEEREISVSFEVSDYGSFYLNIKDEEKGEQIKVTLYNHSSSRNKDKIFHHVGYLNTCGWTGANSSKSERALNTYCVERIERFFFRLYCAQTQINLSDRDNFSDFSVGGCC